MKINFDKHFGNALVYDICNWSFNIATLLFLWKLDHFYAVLLSGLFVLRFAANYAYHWTVLKEQEKMKIEFMNNMKLAEAQYKEQQLIQEHKATVLDSLDENSDLMEPLEEIVHKKDILQ